MTNELERFRRALQLIMEECDEIGTTLGVIYAIAEAALSNDLPASRGKLPDESRKAEESRSCAKSDTDSSIGAERRKVVESID